MYDAIVVGARCVGSPTAMLLAQRGFKVLLVDRSTFPSDTISTHILWPHGAEILARWGLLPRLAATGPPPICRRMTFDVGPFALHGTIPDADDGLGGYCPRRTVLDHILLNSAADAGVEVREGFTVDELLVTGDTVVGIRGHDRAGDRVEERTRIVIGADGVNSFVTRAVKAPEYDTRPVAACGYYSYFSGVEQDDIELYVRDHHAFGGAPTNDGLHLVMVNWPASEFPAVRKDVDAHVWRALGSAPDFAEGVRAGRREEKWYGTAGVPGYVRKPYGQGWALVGDAGYNRDPITAQGMSDALIDAERLAYVVAVTLSGERPFDEAWSAYEAARNERVRPMYEFTTHLAALEPPPPDMQALFRALRGQPGRHQRISVRDYVRNSAAGLHVAREHRAHHGGRACATSRIGHAQEDVMFVIREILHCKPGKVRQMVEKFKGISTALEDMGHEPLRLLTDVTGEPFWTVVAEANVERIEDFFAVEQKLTANESLRKTMADYHELVEDGRREIYRVVS